MDQGVSYAGDRPPYGKASFQYGQADNKDQDHAPDASKQDGSGAG